MLNDDAKPVPTVYIVDDEIGIQLSLKALLGIRGIPVETFSSAESFLESYRHEWRGCLIADLRMPGLDGLGLLKVLHARQTRLSRLLMTGHGGHNVLQPALELGAIDILEKPFSVDQLFDLLGRECAGLFGDGRRSAA